MALWLARELLRLIASWLRSVIPNFVSFGPNTQRVGTSGRIGIGSREGAKARTVWEGQCLGEEGR